MSKKDLLAILNLDESANIKDIENAYILLTNLYSEANMITESLEEEFISSNRQNILDEISMAFNQLMEIMKDPIKNLSCDDSDKSISKLATSSEIYNGQTLKRIREESKIDLEEISLATNIKRQYLINIESEDFNDMPPKVFIKGYLRELARYLNINEDKVFDNYFKKYDKWVEEKR